jgi:hypothetical protein
MFVGGRKGQGAHSGWRVGAWDEINDYVGGGPRTVLGTGLFGGEKAFSYPLLLDSTF